MSEIIFTSLDDKVGEVIVHHPHLHRRQVHFRSTGNGHVILEGEVNSFFEKQMAQEAVRSVIGVTGVSNQLAVSSCV